MSALPKTPPNAPVSKRRLVWIGGTVVALGIAGSIALAAFRATAVPRNHLTHIVQRGDLVVTVIEQGTLESSENSEIKCKVRGDNTVIEVVESGTWVEPGDILVRLDTLFIQEQIAERTKYALWTRSGVEHTKAHLERSRLAVNEYLEGRYVASQKTLEKDLAIAESNLLTAQNMLGHATTMAENGYVSELEVREKKFAVTQAQLAVNLKKTEIDVLENFTKNETLATLNGNLRAAEARFSAEDERLFADEHRLKRAEDELKHCVIKAEKAGMVIHPSAAAWKNAPEIEEGATVYKDQVLLLMPDLSKMQVKIGIHESMIDRIHSGLGARVTLPDRSIDGVVASVASVTSPAGWWTGNQVKYETIIELSNAEGLRPGMSAEVEVIIARYANVLTLPVAAVLESAHETLCWVQTPGGPERRVLVLGDSDDISIVVEEGILDGEEVILNPLASIKEAQDEAARTLNDSEEPARTESADEASASMAKADEATP